MAHRDRFPPGEFAISTTFDGGGSITTVIPSIVDIATGTHPDMSKYIHGIGDAPAGANSTTPDMDSAKLDAMEKAVQTLVLTSQAVVGQGLADVNAAYAVLTKKLYSEDGIKRGAAGLSPEAP